MKAKVILPTGSNVLIALEAPRDKTDSGIILPDHSKEKPTIGVVVALGLQPNVALDKHHHFTVTEGDTVLLPRYGGTEVESPDPRDETSLLLIDEADIMGVIREFEVTDTKEVPTEEISNTSQEPGTVAGDDSDLEDEPLGPACSTHDETCDSCQ